MAAVFASRPRRPGSLTTTSDPTPHPLSASGPLPHAGFTASPLPHGVSTRSFYTTSPRLSSFSTPFGGFPPATSAPPHLRGGLAAFLTLASQGLGPVLTRQGSPQPFFPIYPRGTYSIFVPPASSSPPIKFFTSYYITPHFRSLLNTPGVFTYISQASSLARCLPHLQSYILGMLFILSSFYLAISSPAPL